MKRVFIILATILGLFLITTICLELLGFFNIIISITPIVDARISIALIFGISIGVPITAVLLYMFIKYALSWFKPKFVRIAESLERIIERNQAISHKLNIPQRKEHVISKIETIWRKVEMQYPLSDIDFEKIKGELS